MICRSLCHCTCHNAVQATGDVNGMHDFLVPKGGAKAIAEEQVVALVGHSGGGKSSIVKLVEPVSLVHWVCEQGRNNPTSCPAPDDRQWTSQCTTWCTAQSNSSMHTELQQNACRPAACQQHMVPDSR